MRKYIRHNLQRIAQYLEIIVALIITVMIFISIINMVIHILKNPMEIQDSARFYEFMDDALSLIIGLEFIKMIIIPTSDNVIETLLFAVSRHVILDHELSVMIIGVISVMLLFFTKKYLFSNFEEVQTYIFRGKTRIEFVNKIVHLNLPIENGINKLGPYLENQLKREGKSPRIGSKVMINPNTYMMINSMSKENSIKTVELIINQKENHESEEKENTNR